jgi:hypothetical protein
MGAGALAIAGLLTPITPKLDGARVSRAGSRVSGGLAALVGAACGRLTAAAGSGAVPVPVRAGAAVTGDGAGCAGAGGSAMSEAGAGLGAPRTGFGGGPSDFCGCGSAESCFDGVVTGALVASGALAGSGPGRSGGFGDSVKGDSARSGEYVTAHAIARLEHYKEITDGA